MADEVAVEQIPLDQIEDQAEYVKARNAGLETVERPVEKPVEEETEEAPEPEVAEEQKEKPKGKGGGAEKRISHYAKLAKEAEERASAAQRELEELRKGGKKEEPAAKPKGEPKQEDYTDYERYLIDKAKWEIKEEARIERELEAKKSEEKKAKDVFEEHKDRYTAAQVKYDDFDEVVNVRTPWPEMTATSSAFHTALVEDPNSAEVMYYLGKHPDELAEMGEMTPAGVVKAIGRISDKVGVPQTEQDEPEEQEQAEEKPKRVPPTPIKPINTGSSRSSVTLDKIDDQRAYVKARQAGRIR